MIQTKRKKQSRSNMIIVTEKDIQRKEKKERKKVLVKLIETLSKH